MFTFFQRERRISSFNVVGSSNFFLCYFSLFFALACKSARQATISSISNVLFSFREIYSNFSELIRPRKSAKRDRTKHRVKPKTTFSSQQLSNMAGATAALNNEDLSPTLSTSELSRYDKDIVNDGYSLTVDYVSHRLRNKFEQNKLNGLPRKFLIPQSPISASSSTLRKLATLMEAEHPDLFESLCTTLGITPNTAHPTFVGVAQEIFQAGINWGRIVALFTFGGVVAHHFVEIQRLEMVQRIVEWIADFIEHNLLTWIRENGGWVSCKIKTVRICFGWLPFGFCFVLFSIIFLLFSPILPTSCPVVRAVVIYNTECKFRSLFTKS